LREPDIVSVAYRGQGDYQVLRMLCTEQRCRAVRTGHRADYALHLSTLIDYQIDPEPWDAHVHFFEEGLAHGDLFIEERSGGLGRSIRWLIGHWDTRPSVLLCQDPAGRIAGYTRETSEGWTLYRRKERVSRRRGMELIASEHNPPPGPMLKFAEQGATVYDYDQTLIVIGDTVPSNALSIVAALVSEWQQQGRGPLVIAAADPSVLFEVGLGDAVCVPDHINAAEDSERRAWLRSLLWERQRWIDVALVLGAPEWLERGLAHKLKEQSGPWQPWVVATPSHRDLPADLVLSPDPTAEFAAAHEKAKARRPQRLC